MSESQLSTDTVAREVFKLLFNIAALKSDRFGRQFEERAKIFKLHRKKYFILFCVDRKKNCTLSDIEKMLCENRSTASIAVSKLYREGLINKCKPEKEDDGRKVYFKVTKKGKELLSSFHEIFLQGISSFYDSLSVQNKNHLLNGIENLNKVFEGKSDII